MSWNIEINKILQTKLSAKEHRLTLPFEETNMVIRSTQSIVDLLLQNYAFTDSRVAYSSVIIGILACKMVYGLSRMIGAIYFKSYSGLPKSQQIEWNNRAMSTLHALFITTVSLYFVFWSDLYSNDEVLGPITLRRSTLSSFALGVSAGYFFSDLGMIIWFYPSLGGMEYVIHHLLSVVGVSYAMLTGEAQVYTYMVLTSEATTPWINLRWYLDEAGMKNSRLYLTNGIIIFLAWLVARILLFVYLFYHTYVHYGQVKQMHASGVVLVLVVPFIISVMNFVWFGKIFKGLKKTLAKRKKSQ